MMIASSARPGNTGKNRREISKRLRMREQILDDRVTTESPSPSTTSPLAADQNNVPQRIHHRRGGAGAAGITAGTPN